MQHPRRILALATFAVIGLTSQSTFANVLTVGPSGAQYTQIQSAVNAASDGDVILVSNGNYGGFTISGKSLTVCARVTSGVTVFGPTTVTNLTSSQRVLLSGLRGLGSPSLTSNPEAGVGLFIANNAGNVRVESCAYYGAIGSPDNPNVSGIVCCDMPVGSNGKHAAFIRNNSGGVSIVSTRMEGGRAANGSTPIAGTCGCGVARAGGDGLRVESTLVSLYDGHSIGGRGGDNVGTGGDGGAGCRLLAAATLTGLFSSGSRFEGGSGGSPNDWLCGLAGGKGGTALLVNPTTFAHLLDNTVMPGQGGYFLVQAPWGGGVVGGGSVFNDPDSRLVMTTDRLARAGSVVQVHITGTPGQRVELLVSRAPTFQILPSWRGTLLSDPGKGSVAVSIGTIPAGGVLHTRYLVPPLSAGVTSATVFVQAYRIDPVLGPKLAAGTGVTLLH